MTIIQITGSPKEAEELMRIIEKNVPLIYSSSMAEDGARLRKVFLEVSMDEERKTPDEADILRFLKGGSCTASDLCAFFSVEYEMLRPVLDSMTENDLVLRQLNFKRYVYALPDSVTYCGICPKYNTKGCRRNSKLVWATPDLCSYLSNRS